MIMITGASSGIGRSCAEVFADDPDTKGLVLIARREDRLGKLAEELQAKRKGLEVLTAALDIRSRKAVESFAAQQSKHLKRVDVLINNAGLARGFEPLQNASTDDWDEMIDTNLKGLLYMTHAILPLFLRKNSGHIVNVSSIAGHWVYPKGGVYCATKHAVRALNEALRMDLNGTKIRVSSVSPGMVETEFSVVRLRDQAKADAVYAGMTPLTAQDVAETIQWIVRRPPHVNIQDIVMYPTDQASPTLVSRLS